MSVCGPHERSDIQGIKPSHSPRAGKPEVWSVVTVDWTNACHHRAAAGKMQWEVGAVVRAAQGLRGRPRSEGCGREVDAHRSVG